MRYRFGWVVPVDRPPIRHAILEVAGDRITAVHSADESLPVDHDLSHLAAMPALVNPHTHLEFSLLRQPIGRPEMPFTEWIAQVIQYRQSQGDELAAVKGRACEQGLEESNAAGVGLVGEITTLPLPAEPYASDRCRVVSLLELIGMADERMPGLWEAASAHLQGTDWPEHVSLGLSPHAPYSVQREVVRQAAERSARQKFPLAMHLAETREELELLHHGSGPFREMLQRLGAWNETAIPHGTKILDYLQALAPAYRALVIHGNYLSQAEIEYLAAERDRMTVVYCPRTHAYFGHERYPLPAYLKAGVRVALATDSKASNPDLNLWHEVRQVARQFPEIPPPQLVQMVTADAAFALGEEDDFGTLAAGKLARLAVLPTEAIDADSLWPELIAGQPAMLRLEN